MGVGIRVHGLGRVGRADQVRVRLPDQARLRVVVRELRRGADRAGVGELGACLEAAGEPLVQPATRAGQQLRLDDLAQQLVAEAVAARGLVLQDAVVERRPEAVVDVRLVDLEDVGEEPLVDRPAGDRRGVHDRPCGPVEPRDAREQDLDHRPRTLGVLGGEQLLDEQRVAPGPAPDPVEDARRRVAARDQRQLAAHGVAVQAVELDDDRRRRPLELPEPGEDRVAAREVVDAAREDDREALGREVPRQEREQVARRAVDPVDVLDDEHDRPGRRQRTEQPEDPLEQASLPEARGEPGRVGRPEWRGDAVAGELGDDRGEVRATGPEDLLQAVGRNGPGEATERGRDRQVRQARDADVEAFANQHEPGLSAVRRRVRRLAHEARLADSCLAKHHDEPRRPGRRRVQLGRERVHGALATDEDGTGDPARHAADGTRPLNGQSRDRVPVHEGAVPEGTTPSVSAGVPGSNPTPDGSVTARSGCRSPHSCRCRPGWKPGRSSCTAGWSSQRS